MSDTGAEPRSHADAEPYPELEEPIEDCLRYLDDRFGVDTLWVFGSTTKGHRHAESDLDLAALFRRRPTAADLLDATLALSAVAGMPVHLVNMDDAPPILAHQILKHGELRADHDPRRRHENLMKVVALHEDFRIERREAEDALIRRLTDGRP